MDFEVSSEVVIHDGKQYSVANYAPIATDEIMKDDSVRRLMGQMSEWVQRARSEPVPGMFTRTTYASPDNPYARMKIARQAMRKDDIVSGVADITEALAFDGGLKWESSNPDDADVFNQISADINLDGKIRQMWRETFAADQFVAAKMWGQREYAVRGKTTNGNARKKTYQVFVPTDLVLLDSNGVVPLGDGPIRPDRLAWTPTIDNAQRYARVQRNPAIDPVMAILYKGEYIPGEDERARIAGWAKDPDNLLELNPDWVFRHTSTKADYEYFPDLRLQSVFPLLDLKQQLIASDRAMLIGSANYILLIRKGSDEKPAKQEELDNLKQNYQFIAKLPVIISDHRLEIDVIAPKLDFVLKRDAYDILDARILARVLSTFSAPGRSTSDAGVSSFGDVLASSIQNRRHMLKRTLEREISRAVVEHPRNEGRFTTRPSLVFTPRTVTIGTHQAMLQALLSLRTQREVSRDTILEYVGLDQSTEAQRLEVEEQLYDDIFRTRIPFSADPAETPNGTPEAPQNSGGRGGRPAGGGDTPQSPERQARPRNKNGNSTRENS